VVSDVSSAYNANENERNKKEIQNEKKREKQK